MVIYVSKSVDGELAEILILGILGVVSAGMVDLGRLHVDEGDFARAGRHDQPRQQGA
jgi:hypothetical protein